FNLPAKDGVGSVSDRLFETAVEDLIYGHAKLVAHDVVPNLERIVIPQLGDQTPDDLVASVFVCSFLFTVQVVPETQSLVDAFAADQIEREIGARGRALPDGVLQRFGIVVVDLPHEIEHLRLQPGISLARL